MSISFAKKEPIFFTETSAQFRIGPDPNLYPVYAESFTILWSVGMGGLACRG